MQKSQKLLVTCALPYANGSIHLGHLLEHIQADIWVRYRRMRGHKVYFICADDSHGTPIMLRAQELCITPEKLIDIVKTEHEMDLAYFNISYDGYYSTHCEENRKLVESIYNTLQKKGLIQNRTIHQLYDPEKLIFLPDRFVKGICPKCKASDQFGDNCEQCGATYNSLELIEPRSTLSGASPKLRASNHLFFMLSYFNNMLKKWTNSGVLQVEIKNKMQEWLQIGLKDWDISRDAPYFGFKIPGCIDKYFYVWLDAPIGYISAFKNLCKQNKNINFDEFWHQNSTAEIFHFIGKDIVYFHSLFWPAILESSEFRKPTSIFVHGYLNINGAKMSKSRNTFIKASCWAKHLDADSLRYYFATKLTSKIDDIDLNLSDFVQRVNTDLVNKIINLASRSAHFLTQRFSGKLANELSDPMLYKMFIEHNEKIGDAWLSREFNHAIQHIIKLANHANFYVDTKKPWILAKEGKSYELQKVCSTAINLFRVLMTYLKPVVPSLSKDVETFLNVELCWNSIQKPLTNHIISPYKKLYNRIEKHQVDALIMSSKLN